MDTLYSCQVGYVRIGASVNFTTTYLNIFTLNTANT